MDKPMARRLAFRILLMLLLIASPILLPAMLLWSERRLMLADLRELYAYAWSLMLKGYI